MILLCYTKLNKLSSLAECSKSFKQYLPDMTRTRFLYKTMRKTLKALGIYYYKYVLFGYRHEFMKNGI